MGQNRLVYALYYVNRILHAFKCVREYSGTFYKIKGIAHFVRRNVRSDDRTNHFERSEKL